MDGRHVYSDISKSSWVDAIGQAITIYLINNVFNLRIYSPQYGEKPCRAVTQRRNDKQNDKMPYAALLLRRSISWAK